MKRRSAFQLYSASFFIVCAGVLGTSHPAIAAWNTPTCNPDDVGPTDATCNVSAPLNVSAADQVKTGAIEVQNTVSAEDLIISNSFSGTGNGQVTITTTNGTAVTINQNHTTSRSLVINQNGSSAVGVDINVNSTSDAVRIQQTGNNNALRASTSANSYSAVVGIKASNNDGYGAYFEANSSTNNAAGILVRNQHASGKSAGVFYNGGIAAIAIPGTSRAAINVQTSTGYGGFFYSSTDTGIYAQAAQNGLYATTSGNSYSAVVGVKSANNDGYGGYFEANSNTANAAGILVRNLNATGRSAGVFYHGGIAPTVIPGIGRAAINVQTNTGYGGYFYATDVTNGIGVLANGAAGGVSGATATGAYGVRGSATSSTGSGGYFTAAGTSGYGVYGSSTTYVGVWGTGGKGGVVGTTSGAGFNGVFGENTSGSTGYGGYFLTNTTDAGLRVNNTNSSSGYGAHITSAGNTSTALYVENTNSASGFTKYGIQTTVTTPSGVGIRAVSDYGVAGQFQSTSGGWGLDVNADGSSYGVDIDADNSTYGLWVKANNTTSGVKIQSEGTSGGALDVEAGDFETAIDASGYVNSDTGFTGAPLYGRDNRLGDYGNTNAVETETVTPSDTLVTSPSRTNQLIASAVGDIWLTSGVPVTAGTYQGPSRFNKDSLAETIQYVSSITPGMGGGPIVLHKNRVYIFDSTGAVSPDYYVATFGTGGMSSGGVSLSLAPRTAVSDGSKIWLGGSSTVGYLDVDGSSAASVWTTAGQIVDLMYANGYLWALDYNNDNVVRIDTSSYTRTTIAVQDAPSDMTFDGLHLWIGSATTGSLVQVNTVDMSTTTHDVSAVGDQPELVAFDGTAVWMLFEDDNEIAPFYPATRTTGNVTSITGASYYDMIYDGNYLFVFGNDEIQKYAVGGGNGTLEPFVKAGQLMYGQDGTVYCVYINSAGTLTKTSLVTTSVCI